MRKKNIIALLTVSLMVILVSACENSSDQNDTSDNNNKNDIADSRNYKNKEDSNENNNEKIPKSNNSHSKTEDENDHIEYESYVNNRFGFSIEHPTSFESDYTPTNDDGIELHNNEAIIIASGSHFAYTKSGNINASDTDSIKDLFNNKIVDFKDDNYSIGYQKLDEENNWFVISYVDGENIVYKKTLLAEDFFAELTIKYPKNLQDKYEILVEKVAGSFTITN